jgi:hypothetical protein
MKTIVMTVCSHNTMIVSSLKARPFSSAVAFSIESAEAVERSPLDAVATGAN